MNIQTLCLSILYDKDVTGYEIRKLSTTGNYAYFVEASFGSIYPALNKLEKNGFVTSRLEAHAGSPTKKIYSITDKGRSQFHNSLFDELGEDIFRSEFLLFARFVSLLPVALVKQRLNERLASLKEKYKALESMIAPELHNMAGVSGKGLKAPTATLKDMAGVSGKGAKAPSATSKSDIWVLNYGLNVIEVEIKYINNHMQELLALAAQESTPSKATN